MRRRCFGHPYKWFGHEGGPWWLTGLVRSLHGEALRAGCVREDRRSSARWVSPHWCPSFWDQWGSGPTLFPKGACLAQEFAPRSLLTFLPFFSLRTSVSNLACFHELHCIPLRKSGRLNEQQLRSGCPTFVSRQRPVQGYIHTVVCSRRSRAIIKHFSTLSNSLATATKPQPLSDRSVLRVG